VQPSTNVDVSAINTGTLTIGAGATVTIAAIPGGPLAELMANSGLTPLAIDALSPNQPETVAQPTTAETIAPSTSTDTATTAPAPIAASTAVSTPTPIYSEAASVLASSGSLSNSVSDSVVMPNVIIADTVLPVHSMETTPARSIDTAINRIPSQSTISSRIYLTALPWTIENWLENPRAEKSIINSINSMLTSLQEELPSHPSIIEKRVYTQALFGRQAHIAALKANSRWAYLDAAADFDIAPHFRAGKHFKQFEKAVDTVLAEEDKNLLTILRKEP